MAQDVQKKNEIIEVMYAFNNNQRWKNASVH